jgi:NADH-quinone oxidoreductase subunit J
VTAAFPISRIAFDVAALVAVLFAGFMVVHRHAVKSVLAVVVSFFFLAVCYVLLSAPFIAALQVIVYAGAILVLFLFVLMLLNVESEQSAGASGRRPIQALLAGVSLVIFVTILLGVFRRSGTDIPGGGAGGAAVPSLGEIAPLARLLFTEYVLPFEALSVLLLAALVGAFVLARRESA